MSKCYNKIWLKNQKIWVNCGKCLNCLEEKKKEIGNRAVHDLEQYKMKYMITLTYDEINAVRNKYGETTLVKEHLNKYIKALQYVAKKYNFRETKNSFSYVACGEYGAKTQRAHYHLVVGTNWYMERTFREKWKYGNVKIEKIKSVASIFYTTGYTAKKIGFNEKKFKNKEIAFLKFKRGLGENWIKRKIDERKITAENYYLETMMNGKIKMPTYYKNKIKEYVMGMKISRIKLKPEERLYRKLHFGDDRKTIFRNENEYYENYWRWELFSKKVREDAKSRIDIYYKAKNIASRHKISVDELLYNLLYNEEYNSEDLRETMFTEYIKKQNTNLRIKAEQKYWRNIEKRIAI